MDISRTSSEAPRTQVVVVTADAAFGALARATFGASDQIALRLIEGTLAAVDGEIDARTATVAVIDLGAAAPEDMLALEQLMAGVEIGGYVTTTELAEQMGKSAAAVKRCISRMVAKNLTTWRNYRIEVKRGKGGGIRLDVL